ncbi:CATRA system-associated protein [Nocardia sp. NPDC052566]|uniref:CATRA system-associated protein n=1 Tax=Nocardia sp. NPDC052566 TaxID=3364330 RepID=UPI0037C53F24
MTGPHEGVSNDLVLTWLDEETKDNAIEVLDDLLKWHMISTRWDQVASAIDDLNQALGGRAAPAVREALIEIELLGPVRARRIGEEPRTPAPPVVRDRVNMMVHLLGPDSASPTQTVVEPGDGGDGDRTRRD